MDTQKDLLKSRYGRDIAMVINRTGMSLPDFGIQYGIPVRTLEDWVGGRRAIKRYVLDLLDFKVSYDLENGIIGEVK